MIDRTFHGLSLTAKPFVLGPDGFLARQAPCSLWSSHGMRADQSLVANSLLLQCPSDSLRNVAAGCTELAAKRSAKISERRSKPF